MVELAGAREIARLQPRIRPYMRDNFRTSDDMNGNTRKSATHFRQIFLPVMLVQ